MTAGLSAMITSGGVFANTVGWAGTAIETSCCVRPTRSPAKNATQAAATVSIPAVAHEGPVAARSEGEAESGSIDDIGCELIAGGGALCSGGFTTGVTALGVFGFVGMTSGSCGRGDFGRAIVLVEARAWP